MQDKPLAKKLESVLDGVLSTVGELRKDTRTYVSISSESEDG